MAMAPSTVRRPAHHRSPDPPGSPTLRVVAERHAARPRPRRSRVLGVLAAVLVVGSLLAVAAAHAYLTEGQVSLTRMQHQLQGALTAQRSLEVQVARMEDPSHIVSQAQQQGLTAPSQIGDLQPVSLSSQPPPPAHASTTVTVPVGGR